MVPIPEVLIVAKAATPRGCRTVRVGKKESSARNAAANGAAALGGIDARGIASRSAVGAIRLCIRAVHPDSHSKNAHACDSDQSALHHLAPFGQVWTQA